ncbi:F0F1 ATP synthase subunit A [Candidatus Dependentiae bacterium]|nr:F0F1 ATP synthase subunit A [Candidatus Dependentiae bacterium]MBU4386884.1 F0F1 ATP synthase subunit A [Candidatus Dependentiae bacterium]MCG2755971.1 F0F1 ATP synthase subunit A [Candidatus Dependentiae bacterium]
MNVSIFDENVIKPFESLGLGSKFFHINIRTLIYTWVAMAIIFLLVFIARIFMKKNLNPVSLVVQEFVGFFDNLCKESFGSVFKYEYFAFTSSIFFFTLFGCLVGLLPFFDETTKDINTAFAIGTMGFLYVQYQKIKVLGLKHFLKEFIEPIFIMLPLNIIGELAKVASMSFRLFGNILGGSIIFLIAINSLSKYKEFFIVFSLVSLILYFTFNYFIDLKKYKIVNLVLQSCLVAVFFLAGAQIFFGIFEAFVQSFVITMLTITYLAVAINENESEVKV